MTSRENPAGKGNEMSIKAFQITPGILIRLPGAERFRRVEHVAGKPGTVRVMLECHPNGIELNLKATSTVEVQ
jgi:hypothetical protein